MIGQFTKWLDGIENIDQRKRNPAEVDRLYLVLKGTRKTC